MSGARPCFNFRVDIPTSFGLLLLTLYPPCKTGPRKRMPDPTLNPACPDGHRTRSQITHGHGPVEPMARSSQS